MRFQALVMAVMTTGVGCASEARLQLEADTEAACLISVRAVEACVNVDAAVADCTQDRSQLDEFALQRQANCYQCLADSSEQRCTSAGLAGTGECPCVDFP